MTYEDKLARMQEIARRGIQDQLPPEKKAIFDEAARRGLIDVNTQPEPMDSEEPSVGKSLLIGTGRGVERAIDDAKMNLQQGAKLGLSGGGFGGAGLRFQRATNPQIDQSVAKAEQAIDRNIDDLGQEMREKKEFFDNTNVGQRTSGQIGEGIGRFLPEVAATAPLAATRAATAIPTAFGIGAQASLDNQDNDVDAKIRDDVSVGEAVVEGVGFAAGEGFGIALGRAVPYLKTLKNNRAAKSLLNEASPSVEKVKDTARALYKEIDDAGVKMNAKGVKRLTNSLTKTMTDFGYDPDVFPKLRGIPKRLEKMNPAEVSFTKVHNLRKVLGNAAKSTETAERTLASEMIDKLDDTLEDLGKGLSNDAGAKDVAKNLRAANQLWSRVKKHQLMDDAYFNATQQASGLENGLRIEARKILRNKKKRQGFTKQEIDSLEQIAQGTKLGNAMKFLGKFGISEGQATSTVGAAIGVGGGAAVGGPVGAIVAPILGQTAKNASQAITKANFKIADDIVRSGKQGYDAVQAYVASTPPKSRNAEELADILLKSNTDIEKFIQQASAPIEEANILQQALEAIQRTRAPTAAGAGIGEQF